jgi:hypothetical protein
MCIISWLGGRSRGSTCTIIIRHCPSGKRDDPEWEARPLDRLLVRQVLVRALRAGRLEGLALGQLEHERSVREGLVERDLGQLGDGELAPIE